MTEPEQAFTFLTCAVAILAGAAGGAVNTLAGNGSAITLPMLVFFGLPWDAANGTNRVGVVMGSLVGASTFTRAGVFETRGLPWLMVPIVLGGIVGAIVASVLDPKEMGLAIVAVMIFMLVLVLTQPKRWIREDSSAQANFRQASTVLTFFGIGIYGGFIQAGVGILLLSALVLKARYSLVKANAVKVVLVLTFTIPALAIFIYSDQVRWSWGISMAAGQGIGAWLAARFAVNHPRANIWIRRLLILVIPLFVVLLFLRTGQDT